MKTNYLIILIILLSVFSTKNLFSQSIYFHGTINNDTIFSSDTVKVDGDIIIQDGKTLTINEGVFIEFQGYYKIDVKGRLLAIGEHNNPIQFSVNDSLYFYDTATINGSWSGIYFDNINSTNDSSIMDYCKFMYAKKLGDSLPDHSGGAIYINNFSNLRISNSKFYKNLAMEKGGAIYCGENSSPLIKQNVFKENITYDCGGGIYIGSNSNSQIVKNIFFMNMAIQKNSYSSSGGGIHSSSADLNSFCPKIIKNIIVSNYSTIGAGIYESNYNINIINNIICNNQGGGIFNGHSIGKGKYINNTICYNSLQNGIISTSSGLDIINCIIWGNTGNYHSNENLQIDNIMGNPKVNFYNIQYGFIGTGNIDTLPKFVSPTNSAGIDYSGLSADWSLLFNSNCINGGIQDTSGLFIPDKDILDNSRIVNNRIDMGAIENQSLTSIKQNFSKKII